MLGFHIVMVDSTFFRFICIATLELYALNIFASYLHLKKWNESRWISGEYSGNISTKTSPKREGRVIWSSGTHFKRLSFRVFIGSRLVARTNVWDQVLLWITKLHGQPFVFVTVDYITRLHCSHLLLQCCIISFWFYSVDRWCTCFHCHARGGKTPWWVFCALCPPVLIDVHKVCHVGFEKNVRQWCGNIRAKIFSAFGHVEYG